MHGSNQNLHQDVIRIIASSNISFDEAVKEGIKELKQGGKHDDLEFQTFEVVQLQGTISDSGDS
ncbi:MAG: dodecin domain-containing protein, partial [Cyanobacteria bacterium J06635_10]